MSPVFRHGRLRLYLLKLLDESPRHGYEVIRLLQDQFMGIYAPSPGTIYPRLARLEEEGLVTHDEVDGRKIYRITGKGREELRNRSSDLTELEDEITASVRDIAREVTEDVRETVRNLRRELTFAARDMQRRHTPPGDLDAEQDRLAAEQQRLDAEQQRLAAQREWLAAERERLAAERERRSAAGERQSAARERAPEDAGQQAREDAGTQAREDVPERAREAAREQARQQRDGARQQRTEARQERAEARQERQHAYDQARQQRDDARRRQWERGWDWDWGSWDWAGGDLEQLARHFTRELRSAAAHAQAVSEQATADLRSILDDALERIRSEVFGGGTGTPPGPNPTGSGPAGSGPAGDAGSDPGAGSHAR